ncbi:hypothetical protein [Streptococcus suis]|uniref:hypothetical protein n=2 Tax=Streptococcus suis TaxID=1307 RepID=UPI000CF590FE|nr:hypothetical protein [Streptococcus suis]
MIDERFLKHFDGVKGKEATADIGLPVSVVIAFLKSATDEELSELGYAILPLLPNKAVTNNPLIEDLAKTYKFKKSYNQDTRFRGRRLLRELRSNHDLIASEFLKKN